MAENIRNLITSLCAKVLQTETDKSNHVLNEKEHSKFLKRLRTKSFEILIKNTHASGEGIPYSQYSRCVKTQILTLIVHLKLDGKLERANRLKELIDTLDIAKYERILTVLLCLNGQDTSEELTDYKLFKYDKEITDTRDYRIYENNAFNLPSSLKNIKSSQNPYILHPKKQNMFIDSNLNNLTDNKLRFYSNDIPFAIKVESKPVTEILFSRPIEHNKELVMSTSKYSNLLAWDKIFNDPLKCNNCTWERRHGYGAQLDYGKFISTLFESGGATIHQIWVNHLVRLAPLINAERLRPLIELHPITTTQFINDAKNALVGISSPSFQWSAEQCKFVMRQGLVVCGVIHLTLAEVSVNFLRCASLYKILHSLYVSPEKQIQNGFIFQDLCKKLGLVLHFYRQSVLAFNNTGVLLSFIRYMADLERIIETCVRCFGITTEETCARPLKGVHLLTHVYREFSDRAVGNVYIVYYFLYHATQMYFRRFIQPWIFEGILFDPYDEFFIQPRKQNMCQDRTYWAHGFKLCKLFDLPPFLNGIAQTILLCGKNVHFFKLCEPNSAFIYFISENALQLRLCLTSEKQRELQNKCSEYAKAAVAIDRPVVTFETIHKAQLQRNAELKIRAAISQSYTINRINLQLEDLTRQKTLKKYERIKEYYEQMKNEHAARNAAFLAEKLREFHEIRGINRLKSVEAAIIEDERTKLIAYYSELSELVEKRYQLEDARTIALNRTLAQLTQPTYRQLSDEWESALSRDDVMLIERPSITADYPTSNDNHVQSQHVGATIAESFENTTTPVNHNSPNFLTIPDVAANLYSPPCDNATTPTNNNQMTVPCDEKTMQLQEMFLANQAAAQRNKLKVLTQEMDIGMTFNLTLKRNIDNSASEAPLTELQRNRQRILSRTTSERDQNIRNEQTHKNLAEHELTEFERNRRRILSRSDFNTSDQSEVTKFDNNPNEVIVKKNKETNTDIIEIRTDELIVKNSPETVIRTEELIPTMLEKSIDDKISIANEKQIYEKSSSDQSKPKKVHINHFTLTTNSEVFYKTLKKKIAYQKSERIYLSKLNKHLPVPPYECRSEISFDPAYHTSEDWPSTTEYETIQFEYTEIGGETDTDELTWADLNNLNSNSFDIDAKLSLLLPINAQLRLMNKSIITYLLQETGVMSHFKSLRNYFFLFDSGFQHTLTDGIFHKLYEARYLCDIFHYQILNGIVLKATHQSVTPHSDCVSVHLQELPSVINLQSATVLNCITLSYQTVWPLNIIITENILQKYNDIFKYLIQISRVQWVLNGIFYELKVLAKEVCSEYLILNRSPHYKKTQGMRHVMSSWLVSLQRHVMGVILHSAWANFKLELHKVDSIDGLYDTHRRYIKEVVFRCSLNENSKIFMDCIHKAFECVFQFHNLLRSRQWMLKEDEEFYTHPNFKKLSVCFSNFEQAVKYSMKLSEKQVRRGYQPHLDQMVTLINFNTYYQLET